MVTFGSYYWYNDQTLPLGNHSIKATAFNDQELIGSDSVTIEIEDFRNKYLGNYHFTSVHWCDPENPYTTEYDGWVKLFEESGNESYTDVSESAVNHQWIGNPPPKRRLTIHFESDLIMTPALTLYDGMDFFGVGAWGKGTYVTMVSSDSIEIYYTHCGRYYEGTSITGVKK